MSKHNELKAIIYVLKEGKAYDPSKLNADNLKPVDMLRKRKAEKNPYETNLQDIGKLESMLVKEENHYHIGTNS